MKCEIEVDRMNEFCQIMRGGMSEEEVVALCEWLQDRGFFTAPASTKYHGSYEGGLFAHSALVTEELVCLTKDNRLRWQNDRSPYIVGMFHDLCKIDSYMHPPMAVSMDNITLYDTSAWVHNPETLLKGHGDKSVMLLSTRLRLTEEEVACIRYHMGAFTDKDEWRDYTRAVHQFPNVLWTHHADMLASHVKGV